MKSVSSNSPEGKHIFGFFTELFSEYEEETGNRGDNLAKIKEWALTQPKWEWRFREFEKFVSQLAKRDEEGRAN